MKKTNVRHFILFGGVFCLIREKVIAADACVFICLFFSSSFPLQGNLFRVTLVLRRCYNGVTKTTKAGIAADLVFKMIALLAFCSNPLSDL